MVLEDDESVVFRLQNTMINLLTLPAARDLVQPGTVGTREAGSRFQLTIRVDDVDATCIESRVVSCY